MSASSPTLPPPASPFVLEPTSSGLPGALIGLLIVAILVGLVVLEIFCQKARGIGVCGILMLAPERLFRHTAAIMTLRENPVERTVEPSYEMNTLAKIKIQLDINGQEDDTLRVAKMSHASFRDAELRGGKFFGGGVIPITSASRLGDGRVRF